LHESKIDQEKGNGKIYETWKNDKEQLKRYNIQDSKLILKINLQRAFIEVSCLRANNAHCHVVDTVQNSHSGDYLLLREYKNQGIIMPSEPLKDEILERRKKGKIGGGHTTCKKPGFWKNVKIWDFKSEYPSVITTFNISHETYVGTIYDENNIKEYLTDEYVVTPPDYEKKYHPARVYRKTKKGVIPIVVDFLVNERDKIKYRMKIHQHELNKDGTKNINYNPDLYKKEYLEQYAFKTDGNSIYGAIADACSRYYDWEIADSITTSARATLKYCYKDLEALGCLVLGGDTDSTFTIIKEGYTVQEIDDRFVKILQEWTDHWHSNNNKLVFEFEKEFDTMLFCKKKNYGYKNLNGEIHIVGLEAKKSSTNSLAAKIQLEYVEQVLNEKYDPVYWENKVEELHDLIFDQKMNAEELTLVLGLNKLAKDYAGYVIDKKTNLPKIKKDGTIQKKSIPGHVKLAERLIKDGHSIDVGQKMHYIVIHDKPILAITPEEFSLGTGEFPYVDKKKNDITFYFEGDYDSKYYWKRLLAPLIKVAYFYHGGLPEWNWNVTAGELKKLVKEKDEVSD